MASERYPNRELVRGKGWVDRTKDYLYAFNMKPDRWPAGNPELGLKNCDNSPTKSCLTALKKDDLHCMINLAANPEYRQVKARLKQQMAAELIAQEDPRMLGSGDIFDRYPYGGKKSRKGNAR